MIIITNANELETIVEQISANQQSISLAITPDNFCQPKSLRHVVFSQGNDSYHVEITRNSNDNHDLFAESNEVSNEYIAILKHLFNNNNPKVLANYKDSLHYFRCLDLTLNNVCGDLTLAHYIQNSKDKHSLSSIYKQMLNVDVIDIPSNISKLTKDSIWLGTDTDKIINNLHVIVDNCMSITSTFSICL